MHSWCMVKIDYSLLFKSAHVKQKWNYIHIAEVIENDRCVLSE